MGFIGSDMTGGCTVSSENSSAKTAEEIWVHGKRVWLTFRVKEYDWS